MGPQYTRWSLIVSGRRRDSGRGAVRTKRDDKAFRSGPIYSPSLSALGSAGGNLSGRALAQIAAQFGVDARALIPIITAFGGAVGEVKVNSASASEGEVPLNEPIYEFQNFSEPLGSRK